MTNTIEIQSTIDAENVQYKLFLNDAGIATIRVRDLDAEENVSLVQYPNLLAAKMAYAKLVEKVLQSYQDGGPMVEATDERIRAKHPNL